MRRFRINPKSSPVDVSLYNIAGRKVADLMSGTVEAGTHSLVWDGRDSSGSAVSSGVYLLRLRSADRVITKEMVLTR